MKKKLVIVGGGACALMLASEIDTSKYDVSLFEFNKTLGRKFLVAGDGGLNLTHSEAPEDFIKRYRPNQFLIPAFKHFSNLDFIQWLHKAGIETFVGTSKRVFPKKGIKPIEVLNVFLNKIKSNQVKVFFEHELIDFNEEDKLIFKHQNKIVKIQSQYIVFCLGGASWSVTGSRGNWLDLFSKQKINFKNFQASNCAYEVNWKKDFIATHHGKVLKNIAVSCADKNHFGEIVITKFGLEGSGIYPLSPQVREQINLNQKAEIFIDLKPSLSLEEINKRLEKINSKNITENLKGILNLGATQIALIKSTVSKEDFLDKIKLANTIKKLPIQLIATAPIDDAISTVGGIDLNEIDLNFELKKIKNYFAIGEMLDYDAPTGGYLLQSCFSMAKYLAWYLNHKN